VAGFLFHYTTSGRFCLNAYLRRKVSNVLSPYLVLSALAVAIHLSPWVDMHGLTLLERPEWGWFGQVVWPAVYALFTGRQMIAYWFIPFISLVYLLAPVFYKFGQARLRWQLPIAAIAFGVSLVAWRPISPTNIPHSFVYFIFPYLLGIMWSAHREFLRRLLHGREWAPILLAFTCAALQAIFYVQQGNLTKDFFASGWPDLMLCQKAILSIGLLAVLDRFDELPVRGLDKLAEASFAVYFLHGFAILGLRRVGLFDPYGRFPVVTWLLYSGVAITVSYAAARVLKTLLGNRSRMFIGW
jgi:surface polysaccharide O-acyltransferase-like enzyme